MAELKTKATDRSVNEFLSGIKDEKRREDCLAVSKMMARVTKARPIMWGPSIVGFGKYRYRYESGRELDWFLTGFSPRKQNLTLYIMPGFKRFETLMKKLGKHTTGKSCLYIKTLDDVHVPTLRTLIQESVKNMTRRKARA